MDLVNTFEYKYERLDSKELIAIVHNSKNFQPLAVETAYIELQRRILTPEEQKLVTDDFNLYLKRKVNHDTQAMIMPQEKKMMQKPASKQFFSAVMVINTISLTVLAVFFISIIQGDTVMLYRLVDPSSYRLSFILAAVPYLALPFGAVGFGLRRQLGWIMLAWAVFYNLSQQVYLLQNEISRQNGENSEAFSTDDLVRKGVVIGYFLLLGIVICLPGIRAKMKTGPIRMLITIAAAILFLVLQVMKIVP